MKQFSKRSLPNIIKIYLAFAGCLLFNDFPLLAQNIEFNLSPLSWLKWSATNDHASGNIRPNQLEPIISGTPHSGETGSIYSTIPSHVQQIVEDRMKPALEHYINHSPEIKYKTKQTLLIYLCASSHLSSNIKKVIFDVRDVDNQHPLMDAIPNTIDENTDCSPKKLVGTLSHLNIDGHSFYFTARHVLAGKFKLGKIYFDSPFDPNNYILMQFKNDMENPFLLEDLLVFVPKSFVSDKNRGFCESWVKKFEQVTHSNSPQNNTYDQDEESCFKNWRDSISPYFMPPINKSYWIATQPSNDGSHLLYSAGMISLIDLFDNLIVRTRESLSRNYFALEKNASNHSEPGASGSMIHHFKKIAPTNAEPPPSKLAYEVSSPLGLIVCNTEVHTMALNIFHLLTSNEWRMVPTSLNDLLNDEEQKVPFNYFKDNYNDCKPTDGRAAGGY